MRKRLDDASKTVNRGIGGNLRTLRLMAGLSQAGMADMLGVSFQQVQKYEKGESRMPAEMMHVLHLQLDIPYDYFFRGLGGRRARNASSPRDPVAMAAARIVAGAADEATKERMLDALRALAALAPVNATAAP